MKSIATIMLLCAAAVNMSARNFTISGRFTDVANDTLSIRYVEFEPEKRIVDANVPIDAEGFFSYSCDIGQACARFHVEGH